MGKCDLCGENAGLFKKRHTECEERRKEHEAIRSKGWGEMLSVIAANALHGGDDAAMTASVAEIAERSFNTKVEGRIALIDGWTRAVDLALEDDVLTGEEEEALTAFATRNGLSQDDLDAEGAFSRMVKGGTLRDRPQAQAPGGAGQHRRAAGQRRTLSGGAGFTAGAHTGVSLYSRIPVTGTRPPRARRSERR